MENHTPPELVELTTKIVSAYVSNNAVVATDLPHLISETHAALSRATGSIVQPEREEQKPKVPVKKSVLPDYIICLEDGKKFWLTIRRIVFKIVQGFDHSTKCECVYRKIG